MPLLTKSERQSLTRAERRELRQERREERKSDPSKFHLDIDWKKVDEKATDLILDMAGMAMPPEEKMQRVIDELVDELDDFCQWQVLGTTIGGIFGGTIGVLIGNLVAAGLEQVDGIALKALASKLIMPQVQRVYDRLKAEGKIAAEEA